MNRKEREKHGWKVLGFIVFFFVLGAFRALYDISWLWFAIAALIFWIGLLESRIEKLEKKK